MKASQPVSLPGPIGHDKPYHGAKGPPRAEPLGGWGLSATVRLPEWCQATAEGVDPCSGQDGSGRAAGREDRAWGEAAPLASSWAALNCVGMGSGWQAGGSFRWTG